MRARTILCLFSVLCSPVSARADDLMLLLGSNGGKQGSSYTPPALVNQFAIGYGDSRTANATGSSNGNAPGTQFSVSVAYNNGYPGWYFALSGGKLLAEDSYNYGVGAQTSAGIAGRLTSTRTDCNTGALGASTNVSCFTGLKGTTSGTTPSTTMNTTAAPAGNAWAYENSIVGGEYFGSSTAYALYQDTVTPVSSTQFTLSSAVTSTIPNGTTIIFSPPAASSGFASYLGASGLGATSPDVDTNYLSTGQFSPETDPGQVVFFLGGVNDGNLTNTTSQPQSLVNLAAILDGFGPTQANKIVIAADEIPTGLAEGWSANATVPTTNGDPEQGVVGTSPQTYAVHNGSVYYDTQEVFYAPSGSGPPFVAGTSDGVLLNNCTTGTPAAASGTATCTPGTGQYSVSSAGVYTFNAADAAKKVAIYYRWSNNGKGNAPNYLSTIHDWFNSSTCYTGAGTGFTDPISGSQYPISGAQCNRPWVHVAPTWSAILDPNIPGNCTSGNPCLPKPWTENDGLHPVPAGGALGGNALLQTAISAGAVQSTVPYPLPSTNNLNFSGTLNGSSTAITYDATLCPSISGTAYKYWIYSLSPSISGLTQGQAQALYPTNAALWFSGTPAVELIAGGTAMVDCWDTTHNQVHLTAFTGQPTFTGITTGSHNTTNAMLQVDPTSLISNGLLSHSIINTATAITGCGTSNANCGTPSTGNTVTHGIPGGNGWSMTLSAAMQTAISAGTLGFSYGMETNPFGDGYDAFTLQLQGYAGSAAPQITLTELVLGQMETIATGQVNYGDLHRAHCKISISAGPNGRLTSFTSPQLTSSDAMSATFTPPGNNGAATNYTSWLGIFGSGGVAFSDGSVLSGAPGVSGGVLSLDEITPPSKVATASGTDVPEQIMTFTGNLGDPISATIRVQRCWMGKVAT